MLRERADIAARAIDYPQERARDSNGRPFRVDIEDLTSRPDLLPVVLDPDRAVTAMPITVMPVTVMLVTVTRMLAVTRICPPLAPCRNLKASLISNLMQHHSFLLAVGSHQTLRPPPHVDPSGSTGSPTPAQRAMV
jgi:hypothetical protein